MSDHGSRNNSRDNPKKENKPNPYARAKKNPIDRKQRAMELILEDEIFMGRVERTAPEPSEMLKRIESMVGKKMDDIAHIEDDDEAYIIAAQEIRRIKNQILNELKNRKKN